MRYMILGLVVACLCASAAQAKPNYRWCNGHRCTRPHRVYRIRCGGWTWLSPGPLYVPRPWRENPHDRWWCEANIRAF